MAHAAVEGAEADYAAFAAGVRGEAAAAGLPLGPLDRLAAARDTPLAACL